MRLIILFLLFYWLCDIHGQEYNMVVVTSQNKTAYGISDVDSVFFITTNRLPEFDCCLPGFVNPKLSLKGKKVAFFGDSIMKGYINGYDITDYNFPYWLNIIFGFSYFSNYAVGGARFVKGDSKYKSVKEQIEEIELSDYDVVFIAAGVNDWFAGYDLDEFRSSFCQFLDFLWNKSSNGNQFVFITPISCAINYFSIYKRYPVANLLAYSNIIIDNIRNHDIYEKSSVIRGDMFGFPETYQQKELVDLMMSDKIHPTKLGYQTLYLSGFLDAFYRNK